MAQRVARRDLVVSEEILNTISRLIDQTRSMATTFDEARICGQMMRDRETTHPASIIIIAALLLSVLLLLGALIPNLGDVTNKLYNTPSHKLHQEVEGRYIEKNYPPAEWSKAGRRSRYKSITYVEDEERKERTIMIVEDMNRTKQGTTSGAEYLLVSQEADDSIMTEVVGRNVEPEGEELLPAYCERTHL